MGSSTEKYLGRVADIILSKRIAVIESFEGHKDFALRCSEEEFEDQQAYFEAQNVLVISKQGLLVQVEQSSSHTHYKLSACPECWGESPCQKCNSEGRVYLSMNASCKSCSGIGLATSYSGLPQLCGCASVLGKTPKPTYYRRVSQPVIDSWSPLQHNTYTEKK